MIEFNTIVWLLPIVFMIHDFEEIIFFKSWINKNKEDLSQRVPKLSKRLLSHFEKLSVQAFSLAVAEEFIVLNIITIFAVLCENYFLWLGIFMGFFIHLFVHLMQWIVFRKYVPAIFTSVISLIYCFFALNFIIENSLFSTKEIVLWSCIGFGVVAVNLFLAHKLAEWFDRRILT